MVIPNGRAKSLVGQTFGLLTVLRRERSIGRNPAWLCRCTCGQEIVARGDKLKNGQRRACARDGHYWIGTLPPKLPALHPQEYGIWHKMRDRCNNPKHKRWHLYGGRGIKVCERWNSFANFYADMGDRPSPKHSIDRWPDQNGNYEPGNCRWATPKEQRRNSRDNIYVEYRGERMLLIELMERLGLSYSIVKGRIVNGWSIEDAIAVPVRQKAKNAAKQKIRRRRRRYAPAAPLDWSDGCEVTPSSSNKTRNTWK